MIHRYVKEIKSDFVSPIATCSTVIIPSIRNTVIMMDNNLGTRYYLYEKTDADAETLQNNEILIITPSGNTIKVADGLNQSASFEFINNGIYNIQYRCVVAMYSTATEQDYPENLTFSFSIAVVPNQQPLPKWNIRTVLERVFDVAETHLEGEEPWYKLNDEQAAEFEKIESPEFAFTNMTLKEILDQIGGYIHGIPRIEREGEKRIVYYDMLGGTEIAKLSDPRYKYIAETRSHNIENYATQLDSTVENFVNTVDDGEGAITEPWVGGRSLIRLRGISGAATFYMR